MASRKRKYNLVDVVDQIDILNLSDEELMEDDDTDRDSDFQLSDTAALENEDSNLENESMHVQTNEQLTSEPVNDAISPTLEDESSMHASDDDAPTVSSADDNGQSEWIWIEESYSPPHDVHFSGGSDVNPAIALNKDSLPVEFFNLFVIDDILKLMVMETNRYTNDLQQVHSER